VVALVTERPSHPYALVGLAGIEQALAAFKALCAGAGYPLNGSLDENWLLPSAVGAIRPTCLAPETMTAGDLRQDGPMLIVGFKQFVDFYPGLIADNLTVQGIPAAHLTLDMGQLAGRRTMNSVVLAGLMADEAFQGALIEAIRPYLGVAERVGFPAVFGDYRQAMGIMGALEAGLERPVFEIPGLPPSIPGMRLHSILMGAIEGAGGQVDVGLEAVGAAVDGGGDGRLYGSGRSAAGAPL
jgi:glycerol-3-phosphate dehydrogenase subunit B